MDAGFPEYFVRIDIADAGDECLVEKHRLHEARCAFHEELLEYLVIEFRIKRVSADIGQVFCCRELVRLEERDFAKFSRVTKCERVAVA